MPSIGKLLPPDLGVVVTCSMAALYTAWAASNVLIVLLRVGRGKFRYKDPFNIFIMIQVLLPHTGRLFHRPPPVVWEDQFPKWDCISLPVIAIRVSQALDKDVE